MTSRHVVCNNHEDERNARGFRPGEILRNARASRASMRECSAKRRLAATLNAVHDFVARESDRASRYRPRILRRPTFAGAAATFGRVPTISSTRFRLAACDCAGGFCPGRDGQTGRVAKFTTVLH